MGSNHSFLYLALFVAAITNIAKAECIMRTTSVTKVVGQINDIEYLQLIPAAALNNERMCSITVRVLYKGKWHTVMDKYTGDPAIGDDELCVNAVEAGVRRFLASMEPKLLHDEEQMVCSDEPDLKVRPVRIGETIHLSEVAPHPNITKSFVYKGSTCRWFVETTLESKKMHQWQGIVCKVGRPDTPEWVVVDKF